MEGLPGSQSSSVQVGLNSLEYTDSYIDESVLIMRMNCERISFHYYPVPKDMSWSEQNLLFEETNSNNVLFLGTPDINSLLSV